MWKHMANVNIWEDMYAAEEAQNMSKCQIRKKQMSKMAKRKKMQMCFVLRRCCFSTGSTVDGAGVQLFCCFCPRRRGWVTPQTQTLMVTLIKHHYVTAVHTHAHIIGYTHPKKRKDTQNAVSVCLTHIHTLNHMHIFMLERCPSQTEDVTPPPRLKWLGPD